MDSHVLIFLSSVAKGKSAAHIGRLFKYICIRVILVLYIGKGVINHVRVGVLVSCTSASIPVKLIVSNLSIFLLGWDTFDLEEKKLWLESGGGKIGI